MKAHNILRIFNGFSKNCHNAIIIKNYNDSKETKGSDIYV